MGAGLEQPKKAVFSAGNMPNNPRRLIGDFSARGGYRSADPTGGRIGAERLRSRSSTLPERSNSEQITEQFSRRQQPKHQVRQRGKRHAKKHVSWKRWALRGTLATVIITVGLGGFLAAKGYIKLNQVLRGGGAAAALEANVDPAKLKGEGDGRINILMLGRGGAGHDGPDLTDTLVIASVDPIGKQASLISVPRDLWVESRYGDTKINAVFANAKNSALRKKGTTKDAAEKTGIKAIEDTLEDVTGINLHYYVLVDFKGFEKAVNTVGGVNINVPEELRDPSMAWENNRNPVLAKAGPQTMQGKQALMYVRSRHGSARGDFDRAERQRLFIMALKNKIMTSGTYGNPVKISKLMDDFGDHAQTDFSMSDMMRLYSITKGIGDTSIKSIGLADPPNDYLTTANINGQSVVEPKAGLFSYSLMKTYIRSQLPDGYIKKENAPLLLLNGTPTEGLATKESTELKSYSYNVTKADNAPTKNYSDSVLVDLTGKNKYTKNYLEKRYNTKATRTLPQGITIPEQERKGFVIIIGSNETFTR
jgi:LCP family protein required for cell wall assembly